MENYYDSTNLPKVICGIDSLYYFYKTNDLYSLFFLELIEQLDAKKKKFDDMNIEYSNKDIKVSINNQDFEFNGKAKGFYWFTHFDNIFTVGFKDHHTNMQLLDIQVQLNAIGIYDKLGLKSLLRYTDNIFKHIATGYKTVTRIDLNMFVQADLSWLSVDMFVSRKRKYTTHYKEVKSKTRVETIYIGKAPFLLRLYDKKEELKNSHKNEMMYNYFETYGFNRKDDVFNIEFEMHRTYLRTFGIDTVDDALGMAEKLFKDAMNSIRLVDISSISEKSIKTNNRYKAEIHPLWKYLSASYRLKDFLAFDKPLVKLPKKKFLYTEEEAIVEHVKLAVTSKANDIVHDEQFFSQVMHYLKKYTVTEIKSMTFSKDRSS